MLDRSSRKSVWKWLLVALAVNLGSGLLAGPRELAAQQAGQQVARFQQLLAAGEFGPARALVEGTADRVERDRLLARLAAAQAAVGSSSASISSLNAMRSDRLRGVAISEIAQGHGAGSPGGAAMADFDSLIELITTTVAPDSWEEVGGAGTVESFAGGVYVNPAGVLRRLQRNYPSALFDIRSAGIASSRGKPLSENQLHQASALRKVSLNRLEKQIQLRWLQGQEPTEAMRYLAGIYQVKYLLVYPDTGDIVIAGPAGPWHPAVEGRMSNVTTGKPVLQLDDLVVLLRNAYRPDSRFGCSINPRQNNLAATRTYLQKTSGKTIKASQRGQWLSGLRDAMGKQDVVVFGIDPGTHTARVLVEADYHMKLIGMGLEPGTPGVSGYLENVSGKSTSMNLLRWWFTLNYDAVETTPQRNAYQLRGPGVKVLSENELLTQQGQRLQTGKSDLLTQQFAQEFTRHFEALAIRYPVYAELRNIFDLALVSALVHAEDLGKQVDWSASHFRDPAKYRVRRAVAPVEVESVINHRILGGKQIVAGVSGGVKVDPASLARPAAIKTDHYGLMKAARRDSVPKQLGGYRWWWD
ncbi:MAG: DUF1598 domain-containing protein [Pirellulaceae bacterium]